MDYTVIEGEEWKPIEGIPHYYVSNMGRIKSERCIIKPCINQRTRLTQCMTYVNGKAKLVNVQNIVGRHFLPAQPDEDMIIRHISDDLTDNRACNLTWAYRGRLKNEEKGIKLQRNIKYTIKQPKYKWIIKQKAITGLVIATYVDWAHLEKLGYKRQSVLACANGRYNKNSKTYKGYLWEVNRYKNNNK